MRKFFLSILLASAAASPALAAPDPSDNREVARNRAHDDRVQAREERVQVREDRSQREQRATFSQRAPDTGAGAQAAARADQRDLDRVRGVREAHGGDRPARDFDSVRGSRDPDRAQQYGQMRQQREWRQNGFGQESGGFGQESGGLRQSTRDVPRVMRNPVPVVSNTPRPGTQPPRRSEWRNGSAPQWSTGWRQNQRYDWHSWRQRHRSTFHLGAYYDPFGWGYQQYQIGWRMWPSYYGSNFWLNDPWNYRLPYAPPGTRWVRYWDDAVLVDTWTGEVVDVIQNFFW